MNDIDSIKQGIAEVQSFIQERYDPLAHNVQLLREEQQRLSGHLRESLASQRRMNVLALAQPTSGPRVIGGPYDGLDRLDLAIMRSIATAMRLNPHGLGPRQVMDIDGWIERVDGSRRALDSTTAGAGDELVPTGAASEMWRDVHVQTAIAPLFRTINMPTNPVRHPPGLRRHALVSRRLRGRRHHDRPRHRQTHPHRPRAGRRGHMELRPRRGRRRLGPSRASRPPRPQRRRDH